MKDYWQYEYMLTSAYGTHLLRNNRLTNLSQTKTPRFG